jgi:hypothetical protein
MPASEAGPINARPIQPAWNAEAGGDTFEHLVGKDPPTDEDSRRSHGHAAVSDSG